ncbi:hypothetical protein [Cetobacterium sp.]|uniref:hypothetical protein n=1 Tax=Cetobacterium sp. TaxID=2071632 RepID=UPI003F336F83
MFKIIFIFSFMFNNFLFGNEVRTLPIKVQGKIIPLNTSVVNDLKNGLKEIKITNSFKEDIVIYGKADNYPFIYKIKSSSTKITRFKASNIDNLSFILNKTLYNLNIYSDLKIDKIN